MLAELKRTHDNLSELLTQLESLTAGVFDDAAVTDTRWKLTRESNRRKKLLETVIFPHLLSKATGAEAQRISDLKVEAARLAAESSAHIGLWTRKRIALDWSGYQRASRQVRNSMRERITSERAVLYPLLDRNPGRIGNSAG